MKHWSHIAERGSMWGLQLTLRFYRLVGRRATLWLLYPIVLWFMFSAKEARRSSLDYLQRLYLEGALPSPPGWRDSYRHFRTFAIAALDKVAAWMGNVPAELVDFEHHEELEGLHNSRRGALIIGSHLGHLEMARALRSTLGHMPVTAIVYTDHAVRFNRILSRCNPEFSVDLIQVSSFGPQTAIDLSGRIERGELIFIVGDRTPAAENGRICRARFFGLDAPFAQGPYILASLLRCPVYLFFCLEEKGRFKVYLERFSDRLRLPRGAREQVIASSIQRYAERLEHYCRLAPYQWFNFFDFWHIEDSGAR
jgi:predicted LPLAT superfamily acyltransferase